MLDPKQPTTALPGTAAKIDEMHRRARLVLRLHHPDDAKGGILTIEQGAELMATESYAQVYERERHQYDRDGGGEELDTLDRFAEHYWQQLQSVSVVLRIHAMRCLHGMGVPLDTINQHTPATVLPPIRVRRRRFLSRSPV